MQAMDRMRRIRLYELHPSLSPAEGQLLTIIAQQKEGLTVSALAKALDMPMPAVSRMMKNLEQRNLLERRILPQDRRSILVTITPEGEECTEEFLTRLHRFFHELLQAVDPHDFDKLMQVLNNVMDQMEIVLERQLAEIQP